MKCLDAAVQIFAFCDLRHQHNKLHFVKGKAEFVHLCGMNTVSQTAGFTLTASLLHAKQKTDPFNSKHNSNHKASQARCS